MSALFGRPRRVDYYGYDEPQAYDAHGSGRFDYAVHGAYNDPMSHNGFPSPIVVKFDRELNKREGIPMFYHPFYGMTPIGTCPGCGGKTALIPTKTPSKFIHPPPNDFGHDFLDKINRSSFTPLISKHESESKHSSEIMYSQFLSPSQVIKKNELQNEEQQKTEKLMYQFSISDSKNPFLQSPPTNKKQVDYSASGAKIYKDDVVVSDLHNHLFSQDLVDDENHKNLFSFLKKGATAPQLSDAGNKSREAFSNITNTLNKSPTFKQKESTKKILDNCVPKVLSFDQNKPQQPSQL